MSSVKGLIWLNMANAPTTIDFYQDSFPNFMGPDLSGPFFFAIGVGMSIEAITSHANQTVKLLRSLHDKKQRQAEGLFLAEGLRILTEALEAGHAPQLLAFGDAARAHPLVRKLITAALDSGGKVIEVSDEILGKIARKDNPQMVVAAYRLFDLSLAALDARRLELCIALEGVKDPGNLGTILRTGDAVGASAILLIDDGCDPFSTEAVRASMGALFTQRIARARWRDFLNWSRKHKMQVTGAYLHDRALDYRTAPYVTPCCLLMGNEQSGLPDDYAAACDLLVKMPMHGKADSLNVAMATTVLAYEVRARLTPSSG
jgi:RNA methyltransferase, TrmH family